MITGNNEINLPVAKSIKIYSSFEEQDAWQLEQLRKTTPLDRLRNLYYMQQLSLKFHPKEKEQKKIIVSHGFTTS